MTEKPGIVRYVEENFQDIECTFYSSIGLGAYGAAFGSVFTGQFWATAGLTAIGGAAELAYNLAGCNGSPPEPPPLDECWEYTTNSLLQVHNPDNGPATEDSWQTYGTVRSVDAVQYNVPADPPNQGMILTKIDATNPNGEYQDYQFLTTYIWRLLPEPDAECKKPGLPRPSDDTPIGPPITYNDEKCTWTITPMDAYVDDEGLWHTFFVIESNDPAICGGPFSYWSSRRGPQWDEPETPFPPTPDPPTACREGPQGPQGPVGPQGPKGDPGEDGCSCDHIDNKFAELTAKLDEFFARSFGGANYELTSVCAKDAQGAPIQEKVTVNIPDATATNAQISRLDAIVELLQAHKNFQQPICPNEKPKLEGDWRTISFRSTQSSPYGKSCLRKRFRYRSVSGIGLGELVDHWKDFTWTTGAVCVTHKGHTWGTPQVWAATADEGKRVIQHAAREAGFDADQVGEWGISNSASARYGVSLPVKVDTTGGYYWITNRDGSNQRPVVAIVPNP